MKKKFPQTGLQNLPACAVEFIRLVIKKMRYRKKVREDVQAELAAHFEDELKDLTANEEREQKAERLIAGFGDVKLLAVLLRRAKKRCRPLWRTVIARTFQAVVIIFVCLVLYVVWFSSGRPTISLDYVVLLNDKIKPDVLDEDNAWSHYEKAIALFDEPADVIKEMASFSNYRKAGYKGFGNLAEGEQAEIRKWIEKNEAAWQKLVAGSLKSYCYRKYKRTDDKGTVLFNIDLSHLLPLKALAMLGVWRAWMEMEHGQIEEALRDCLVVITVGRHWQGKGAIVEQLVGMLIENGIVQTTFAVLDEKQLSAELLKNFQNKLEDTVTLNIYRIDFQVQKFFFRDAIQHCFTDDGKGSGHLIPGKMEEFGIVSKDRNEVLKDLGYTFGLNGHKVMAYPASLRKALVSANRREMLLKFETAYDKYENWVKMTPWQLRGENVDFEMGLADWSTLKKARYVMFYSLMPSLQNLHKYSHQNKAQTEALVATLAILRYKQDVDSYPENLEQLVATGYLKELPMDPYSDEPLVYRRTDDGFTLYSAGPNFIDDGGKMAYNKEGKPRWRGTEEDGDTVFWPVAKSQLKQ